MDALHQPSLVVVGLGINPFGQLTVEAIAQMRDSEVLFCLGADPVGEAVARSLNPKGFESLSHFYQPGKDRMTTYEEITNAVLGKVRQNVKTCVAFYGHPAVYNFPTRRIVSKAREEGFTALVLPAVSAEGCLYADLGIDPATDGMMAFEATDFLVRVRRAEPTVPLILWQIGVIGNPSIPDDETPLFGLSLLVSRLLTTYPENHQVILYEAASLPGVGPTVQNVALNQLINTQFSPMATLFVPPTTAAPLDQATVEAIQAARKEALGGPCS